MNTPNNKRRKESQDKIEKFFGSTKNKEYHIEFFKTGLNAIIKKWLNNGCAESPEEIEEILKSEYKNRIQN